MGLIVWSLLLSCFGVTLCFPVIAREPCAVAILECVSAKCRAFGSGFFFRANHGQDDVVVTARHVIESFPNASLLYVALNFVEKAHAVVERDTDDVDYDITYLKLDPQLKSKRSSWYSAELAKTNVLAGTPVYTWGFPFDKRFPPTVSFKANRSVTGVDIFNHSILSVGYVSVENPQVIGLDMHTHGGNSGGPIFNLARQVVGIVTSTPTPWAEFDDHDNVSSFNEIHSAFTFGLPIQVIRSYLLRKKLTPEF